MNSEWYQQSLTPPTVVEINARVGVIVEQDHVQALVEVKDPTTGVLLGQWSMPHTSLARLPEALATVAAKLQELALLEVEPF